jgi:6,7-dimethyl-8-ribityllumazine synthase
MNQMLQDAELSPVETPEPQVPETPIDPPSPAHPRFIKPQRVAFVQAAWHREVVEECRIAFLKEIEARHITNVDLFEVPGSFEMCSCEQRCRCSRRF